MCGDPLIVRGDDGVEHGLRCGADQQSARSYSNTNGSPSANSPLTTGALTMMTLTKRSGRPYRELNSFLAKTCRRRDYDVPQRAA